MGLPPKLSHLRKPSASSNVTSLLPDPLPHPLNHDVINVRAISNIFSSPLEKGKKLKYKIDSLKKFEPRKLIYH